MCWNLLTPVTYNSRMALWGLISAVAAVSSRRRSWRSSAGWSHSATKALLWDLWWGQPKQRMIPGCAANRGACDSSVASPNAHMAASSVPGGQATYVFLWLLTGVSPFLPRM